MDTLPALVFIATTTVLLLTAWLFTMLTKQQQEIEHLHAELYAWRRFSDSIEFIDTPNGRTGETMAPQKQPKTPRPIPEGLTVIHPITKPNREI